MDMKNRGLWLTCGLVATAIPASLLVVACSGADQQPADPTNVGDEAADAAESAVEGLTCTARTQTDAPGWAWRWYGKGNKDKCSSQDGLHCMACGSAPGCNAKNNGKRMRCVAEGSHNDWNFYRCEAGAPKGPTPKTCTGPGGSAASFFSSGGGNGTSPGHLDSEPGPGHGFGRSW